MLPLFMCREPPTFYYSDISLQVINPIISCLKLGFLGRPHFLSFIRRRPVGEEIHHPCKHLSFIWIIEVARVIKSTISLLSRICILRYWLFNISDLCNTSNLSFTFIEDCDRILCHRLIKIGPSLNKISLILEPIF
jgi:hypothetical protein